MSQFVQSTLIKNWSLNFSVTLELAYHKKDAEILPDLKKYLVYILESRVGAC